MAITKLKEVGGIYGAPMGRRSHEGDASLPLRFYLRREYLDSGGYDSGGAYWGFGSPLYRYESDGSAGEDETVDGFLRAYDRADAKEAVRAMYPAARFFN